jgi:hypothetical protein
VPLSDRGAARLAWSAFALTVVFAIAAAAFGVVDHGTRLPATEGDEINALGDLLFALIAITFGALGAVLASRRPDNPIGWILCLSPVALSFTGIARGWYLHTLFADPGSLPFASSLVWAANWAWVLSFIPLLTVLLLLFPDGGPPTRRWWPLGWLTLLAMGMLIAGYAFAPGPLEDYPGVDNPLGVEGSGGEVLEFFRFLGFPLFGLTAIGSMASLAIRFRRSRGEERQQLKWMAAAAALVVVSWMVTAFFDQALGLDVSLGLTVGLLALPAATTIAVLRYRLYDLELVVNRTLVYGALSATLAGAYLGSVLLQLALSPLTEQSDLAFAGSTLAVAALFRPARARIQDLVDRRFYRSRYDAARTVEAFSSRLRDEVELDALTAELRNVARDTMQPAHVSLWLRPETGR